jgi:hypothetical protein
MSIHIQLIYLINMIIFRYYSRKIDGTYRWCCRSKKACAKRSQGEDRTRNLILPCEINDVGGETGATAHNWNMRTVTYRIGYK